MNINIKKLNEDAMMPTRGSACAAGYDLYAHGENKCISINPGETVKVGTGVSIEIPDGYFGAIFARSGLATKRGLRPSNCVGVIDSDYRGEIMISLHNDSQERQYVHNGERVAQIVVIPFVPIEFNITDTLTDTKRGDGGFGSTGK